MAAPTATQRELVLKMSVSLDGFVCGPNGESDWIFRSAGGADSAAWLLETLRGAGAHLMGSRTFRDMAAFWPLSDMPIAAPMNDIPKVVFSRTGLDAVPAALPRSWAQSTVARGELAEEILRLKRQPGPYLLAHGGAAFARSLVASGLVDEYRLAIHPVVLGQGQALFSGLPGPADLRLVSATPFASGAVALVYRPA